jgi:hypothetical protein
MSGAKQGGCSNRKGNRLKVDGCSCATLPRAKRHRPVLPADAECDGRNLREHVGLVHGVRPVVGALKDQCDLFRLRARFDLKALSLEQLDGGSKRRRFRHRVPPCLRLAATNPLASVSI